MSRHESSRGSARLSFALALIVPAALALDGGAFDILTRQRAGLICWGLIALGLILGVLPRARPTAPALAVLAAFAALAVLTFAALLVTSSAERTIDELARVVAYAGAFTVPVLTLHRETWRAAGRGLALGALLVCVLALAARLTPAAFGLAASDVSFGDRLGYPFGYWNSLAAWAAMALTMCLAFSSGSGSRAFRAVCLSGAPLCIAVLYLTYSRGGVLAALAGAGFVVAMSREPRTVVTHVAIALVAGLSIIAVIRTQPEIASGTGSAGALVVLGSVLLASGACSWVALRTRSLPGRGWPRLRQRLRTWSAAVVIGFTLVASIAAAAAAGDGGGSEVEIVDGGADPASRLVTLEGERPRYWRSALQAFQEAPGLGIGPGTFEFWWTQNGDSSELVADAHSLYLEQLAELGLPGLITAVLLVGGCAWAALRETRGSGSAASVALPGAVLVYAALAGLDWLWESPAVTVLALVAAGCGAAARGGPRSRRPIRAAVPSWMGMRWWALLLAVSLLALATQVPGLVQHGALREAEVSRLQSSYGEAAEQAARASDAAPWAATPYAELMRIDLERDRPRAARLAALEARRREPQNFRHSLALAEIEEDLGHAGLARAALEEARGLAPRANILTGDYARDLEARIRALNDG